MKSILIILISLFLTQSLNAQLSKIIEVSAGGLSSALTPEEKNVITKLKIKGFINAFDFKTMRDSMDLLEEIDLSEAEIEACWGSKTSNINPYTANSIPYDAFKNKNKLLRIIFPLTLEFIERGSFSGCSKLSNIEIPSSVEFISPFSGLKYGVNVDSGNKFYSSIDGVLFNKSQTEIIKCPVTKSGNYIIPSTVINIGDNAFASCKKLESIIIPSSVKSIGSEAFTFCDILKSITIPSSVTSIGFISHAPIDNSSVTINVEDNNPIFSSHEGVLIDKTKNEIVYCPQKKMGSYTIPPYITSIGREAFFNCYNLTSIIIPPSVKNINRSAFQGCCYLKDITIQSSNIWISNQAFDGCRSINSISLFSNSPFSLDIPYDLFDYVNKKQCKLFVPFGSKNEYQLIKQWNEFSNIIEMTGIFISEDKVTLEGIPVTDMVYISSSENWTAFSDKDWLRIESESGNSDTRTITFSATTNNSKNERTATITVSSLGQQSKKIIVTQKSKPSYAIVTTKKIMQNSKYLELFGKTLEEEGYNVVFANEDDFIFLKGQYPNERADKIRQWLINNYKDLNIEYVLLIGDPTPKKWNDEIEGDIPMKTIYTHIDLQLCNYPSTVSDYYYSDLTANWDIDGDGFYGENRPCTMGKTPDPRIDNEMYSIRWTGQIDVSDASGMVLEVNYNNAIRVWIENINGEPVIDDWVNKPLEIENLTAFYKFSKNGVYNIKIESRFYKGNADIGLEFKNSSSFHNYVLLYWDGRKYIRGGLNGEYFNDENLEDFIFQRIDRYNPKNAEGISPSNCASNELYTSFAFNWMSDDEVSIFDYLPEVKVGRIPVYDNDYTTLDNILLKTIKYKKSKNTCWRNNILLPMSNYDLKDSYIIGQKIVENFCINKKINYFRIFDDDYNIVPPPESIPCNYDNVMNAWANNPFGLVTWHTHGSEVAAVNIIHSSNVYKLNDNYPSIVFQGSCNNGTPENKNNLGYSLLKNGAIATVSAARVVMDYGFSFTNDISSLSDYAYYFNKQIINGLGIGDAISKIYKLTLESEDSYYSIAWQNLLGFNLYGDPSIKLDITGRNGLPKLCSEETVEICEGESYQGWTEAGDYERTLESVTGCDSIFTTHLVVNPVIDIKENITICEGESYQGWTEAGDYERTLVAINGCDSIVTTHLYVENIEKPTITIIVNDLISSYTSGNQWYFEQAAIEGAINQNYTIAKTGDYSVQVTSNKGCISKMSDVVNVTYTSINEIVYEVKIYPNPTTGIIKFEGLPQNEKTFVSIFNVMGQNLEQIEINTNESTINLSSYKKGIYFLSFINSFSSSVKIIKE